MNTAARSHQPPFTADLRESPEQEAREAHRCLDLAEDGLDDLFPQTIATSAAGSSEFLLHRRHASAAWTLAHRRRLAVSMLDAARRDVRRHVASSTREQIRLGDVAIVRRDLSGLTTGVEANLSEHLIEERSVVLRRVDLGSDNDLALGIDGGLRVVALHVSVAGLEDAALRIGEVSLRLRVWKRRFRVRAQLLIHHRVSDPHDRHHRDRHGETPSNGVDGSPQGA